MADELTSKDWGKIHAKAWLDPDFRYLLETDPTKAIRQYGKEVGKTFDKIVKLRPPPKAAKRKGMSPEVLEEMNPFPPWCC